MEEETLMNRKPAKHDHRVVTIVVILVTLSLGCLCLPTNITPTNSPPTQPVSPPIVPTHPVVEPPTEEAGVLTPTGPWLVFETHQGLWIANPDGSGLTQLTDKADWGEYLSHSLQPGGNLVAFISGTIESQNMDLHALTLPDGNEFKITDLTSPEVEAQYDLGLGYPGYEALGALEQGSLAWSPDGSQLAFLAAVGENLTTEVYLLDIETMAISQVSHDDDQDFSLSWSPDGKSLLYLTATGFGSGAGIDMTGVWVASGDGSSTTQLYSTSSFGEEIVGWLDNTSVVLYTMAQPCGNTELRLYDVVSRQETMLNEGCFTSAAVNSGNGTVLFSNDDGLYMATMDNPTPVQVAQEPNAQIYPMKANDYVFTVRFNLGGIITYGINQYDQELSPVNADANRLDVAVYGAIWAWTSRDETQPGVWITGPGLDIGRIYSGKAVRPIWDLHNNLIFFAPEEAGGYSIYRTTFDNYYQDLAVVGSINLQWSDVTWVEGK
jgi:hypothetical protein